MVENRIDDGDEERYRTALRRIAEASPSANRLDLVGRRRDAELMADIMQDLHGDSALEWARRMEEAASRRVFARMVRIELERRAAAQPMSG